MVLELRRNFAQHKSELFEAICSRAVAIGSPTFSPWILSRRGLEKFHGWTYPAAAGCYTEWKVSIRFAVSCKVARDLVRARTGADAKAACSHGNLRDRRIEFSIFTGAIPTRRDPLAGHRDPTTASPGCHLHQHLLFPRVTSASAHLPDLLGFPIPLVYIDVLGPR